MRSLILAIIALVGSVAAFAQSSPKMITEQIIPRNPNIIGNLLSDASRVIKLRLCCADYAIDQIAEQAIS